MLDKSAYKNIWRKKTTRPFRNTGARSVVWCFHFFFPKQLLTNYLCLWSNLLEEPCLQSFWLRRWGFYDRLTTRESCTAFCAITEKWKFVFNTVTPFSRQKPLKSKNKSNTTVWRKKFYHHSLICRCVSPQRKRLSSNQQKNDRHSDIGRTGRTYVYWRPEKKRLTYKQ